MDSLFNSTLLNFPETGERRLSYFRLLEEPQKTAGKPHYIDTGSIVALTHLRMNLARKTPLSITNSCWGVCVCWETTKCETNLSQWNGTTLSLQENLTPLPWKAANRDPLWTLPQPSTAMDLFRMWFSISSRYLKSGLGEVSHFLSLSSFPCVPFTSFVPLVIAHMKKFRDMFW